MKGSRPCPGYDSNLRIHDEGSKLRKKFGKNELSVPNNDIDATSPATSNTTPSSYALSADSSPEEILDLVVQSDDPDYEAVQAVAVHRAEQLLPAYNAFFQFVEFGVDPNVTLNALQSSPSNSAIEDGALSMNLPLDLSWNTPIYSPYLAQEQLLNTFASAIGAGGPQSLPRQMQNHTRWLAQLPSYFGRSLLDAAIRAVSMVHFGRISNSEVLVQESRQFYGNALRLLNKALTDQGDGMASETLSATVLLSFYEMFASSSNSSWLQHAGGAGLLMRLRGPDRHRHGLDRDCFLAYRHTIVIEAFQRDEECFLAKPEWLELSKQVHEEMRVTGISPERREIFDLGEEFYLENVHIPATFRDARHTGFVKGTLSPEGFHNFLEGLLERTRQHRYKLKSINVRFRAALQKTGLETTSRLTSDKVFPLQYVYVNVFIASTNVGYWTIMLLLNMVLKEAEKETHPERTGLYLMENHEIAMEICRTAPFMLTSSFLGPFFITFALRLCLVVFEPGQQRDWVIAKLKDIGATRISMASDIPDFEAGGSISKDMPTPS